MTLAVSEASRPHRIPAKRRRVFGARSLSVASGGAEQTRDADVELTDQQAGDGGHVATG